MEFNEEGIERVFFIKSTKTQKDVYDDDGEIIDSSRHISQEELNAQVNKIYTTRNFTFIQFAALVEQSGNYAYRTSDGEGYEYVALRPEGLTFDKDGVADFDKCDYFSNNLTASFVIDNDTGYIYKIENFYVKGFCNGLVFDREGNYYKISVDEEDNLCFTDVLPNKGARIDGVYLDNYGWVYVTNDIIEEVDKENKIYYISQNSKLNFCHDADGNVYIPDYYYGVYKKMVDGEPVDFANEGIISGLDGDCFIGMYDNLAVYDFALSGPNGYYAASNKEKSCGLWVGFDCSSLLYWLDDNFDIIIMESEGKLYYKRVDLSEYEKEKVILHLSDFTLLSEKAMNKDRDYTLQVGKDKYKIENVYFSATASGTSFFRLQKKEKGVELIELNSLEYSEKVFIFQPINKRS